MADDGFHALEHLPAVLREAIESPCPAENFHRALVEAGEFHALRHVENIRKGAVGVALRHDALHGPLSYVLERAQRVAHGLPAICRHLHRKVGPRRVDIGRPQWNAKSYPPLAKPE